MKKSIMTVAMLCAVVLCATVLTACNQSGYKIDAGTYRAVQTNYVTFEGVSYDFVIEIVIDPTSTNPNGKIMVTGYWEKDGTKHSSIPRTSDPFIDPTPQPQIPSVLSGIIGRTFDGGAGTGSVFSQVVMFDSHKVTNNGYNLVFVRNNADATEFRITANNKFDFNNNQWVFTKA